MEKTPQITLILVTLAILAGCVCPGGDGKTPGLSAQSNLARVMSPDVPTRHQTELVSGNSAFALDLYHHLKGKDGNLFYSPYSISLALAMTYAGARGETERQMADTLHFVLSQDDLHPAFNWLDLELGSRGRDAEGKDGESFQLNIVNRIWGQEGYEFLPEYLDTLAVNYGAGMQLMDFIGDAENSRVAINDWVSDQTNDKIKDLLPPGVVNAATRLVLTNAIYFNAGWAEAFDESATADRPFFRLDGSEIKVPMMKQTTSLGYAKSEGCQAVELPYDGDELAMVILLPDEGTFEAFEESLDARQIDAITGGLAHREVALTMPKFKIESEFGLASTLSAMGMPIAFTTSADFSGMDATTDLFISEVIHKAFVDVNESGTEAAAATGVVMEVETAAEPEPPIEVVVDHPFIFFIRDIDTGTILFVGRIMDPTS
jgi:serpin B